MGCSPGTFSKPLWSKMNKEHARKYADFFAGRYIAKAGAVKAYWLVDLFRLEPCSSSHNQQEMLVQVLKLRTKHQCMKDELSRCSPRDSPLPRRRGEKESSQNLSRSVSLNWEYGVMKRRRGVRQSGGIDRRSMSR